MLGRDAPVRGTAEANRLEETPFFQPFNELFRTLGEGESEALRDRARHVVEDSVLPAFATLRDFLSEEYIPNLPETIAAHDGPDGVNYYQTQLRKYTTTTLDPAHIFDVGVDEVQKINDEMNELAAQAGFADASEMLAYMRESPEFYVDAPEKLLKEGAWQAKKFDGVVHRYFSAVPRGRFGIVEPPPDIAPFYTYGRGAPHSYILNTYNLAARPLYSLPALTLHEAAPGHSFQTSLALELCDKPPFRREAYFSAYGEGWALYCERLGVEMGMYQTPFELMGMLSFQMWRAVRLVIDPGIHAFGWSREQAQAFLHEHTAIAEHEVQTEVDRYIAWPGQAASYYLGQLKIFELRRRVEHKLGAKFDLRDFHGLLLTLGSVPLNALELAVDHFVENYE